MNSNAQWDAVVVGAGPNGLSAAITLAGEGLRVLVLEANDTIGGGGRSAELTLPGFIHDTCSAIHPLAVASPFFRQLPLEKYGLEWIHPPLPLAHPFDNGTAAVLQPSVLTTADALDADGAAYKHLMLPLVTHWKELIEEILQPPLHLPRHPLALMQFVLRSRNSAATLARNRFHNEPARALFAGLSAHSFVPLEKIPSAAFGIILGLTAHAVGWPMPRGGTRRLTDALSGHLQSLGGKIETGRRIHNIDDVPKARAVLLDLTPRQFLKIAAHRMSGRYRSKMRRFRYGPAAFKIDYALSAPIPWRATACAQAGTVHLGGTFAEIALAEREAVMGRIPEKPFVLVAQQSLFDSTRAPTGKHTAWVYAHVPHGWPVDATDKIEAQIERFAPGFRDVVLARHVTTPQMLEHSNPNLVGGDINGGYASLRQLLARPVLSRTPYRTPMKGVYLCSASTPPGGGVHGMCGFNAARAALRFEFNREVSAKFSAKNAKSAKERAILL